ncbi:MAG: MFS transporter [Methanobacteriaceae archaeon]|nr:MFS transporter [Methanobacteriaceae archaeon]
MTAVVFVIDSSIMSVSISNLVVDLKTTTSGIQFAIALYTMIMGSLLLLGGKIQDIIGRKKTFVVGTALFAVGAFITVISFNLPMVVLGWSVIEGIGAALMLPAIIAFISKTYIGKERIKALGIFGAATAVAAASGPLVGGFLATYFSWRVAFSVMVIIAVILWFYSRRLEETEITATWRDLDIPGALTSFTGLLLLLIGIMLIEDIQNILMAVLTILVAITLLSAFFFLEKRRINNSLQPLVDIRLFKNKNFTLGNITRLITNIVLTGGLIFIFPIFVQQVMGFDAFMTGVTLLPATLGTLSFALLVTKFTDYLNPRRLVTVGLIIQLVGIILLLGTFSLKTTIWDLLPGIFLLGAGYGFTTTLLPNNILVSAPKDRQNDASSIMETGSRLGQSIGTALIGTILLFSIFMSINPALDESGLSQMGVTEKDAIYFIEKMQTKPIKLPPELEEKAVRAMDITISESMNTTLLAAAFFNVISIVLSLLIKETG